MKRLIFGAFVGFLGASLTAVAACDPDLTPATVPGASAEGGAATDAPTAPPIEQDSGPPTEGGADDSGEGGAVGHVIDGTNDFAPDEKLATSSPQYEAYISWDDTRVYFGMSGDDIGGGSGSKWVLIYVDGKSTTAGTTNGIAYDCGGNCTAQAAKLPFDAGFHLRWKANGEYTNLQKWDGAKWSDVGPISTSAKQGKFMEVSLTRALLGSPTTLKVHMNMLIEEAGVEWTYAGVPSASFTDGKNPAAFTKFYEFDLADEEKAPSAYAPKP